MEPWPAGRRRSVEPAPCPFCQRASQSRVSLFGQLLTTAQYYCSHCRVTFEHVRREGREEPGGEGTAR